MPHLMLTWQSAAVGAAILLLVGSAMMRFASGRSLPVRRPTRRPVAAQVAGPVLREAGVILALYALWQYAGGLSLGRTGEAVNRGIWIWHTERTWKLPSEKLLQDGIVGHPLVAQACNIYYATMHFGLLIAMLVWLFFRHRDAYPRVRMTIVLTTAACLAVALVPVAPPRLVHVGMVDVAAAYGQSVYAITGAIGADQYSAMPSVHVAWAALVTVAVITASRSKWRWLILLHFVATVFVVVATANHFWADGIVALALLGLALLLQASAPRLLAWLRLRRLYAAAPEAALSESDEMAVP